MSRRGTARRPCRCHPPRVISATTIGPYQLRDVLGRGGMGVVYRAHDPRMNRDVAIKVIRGVEPGAGRDRFLREARSVGRLRHSGIVPVYGVGSLDDGQPYVVMECVEGRTLAAAADIRAAIVTLRRRLDDSR